MKLLRVLYFSALLVYMASCSDNSGSTPEIEIISVTANGAALSNGTTGIPIDAEISIVFSSKLDPSLFEPSVLIESIDGTTDLTLEYANAGTKAIIDADLEFDTDYVLTIQSVKIGENNEVLKDPFSINFTTASDGVIRTAPPCTSISDDCVEQMQVLGEEFEYYRSYPLFEGNAEWEELRYAVIVVHGINRNANDYYSYLLNALTDEELINSTVLISPFFKTAGEAGINDLHWTSTGWREGKESISGQNVSSFEVIDMIIDQLANVDRFPVLEKIIITGHSSGGLFSHVYSAANKAETEHPGISMEYIVANSQYFYYPGNSRLNESSGMFFEPAGCFAYNRWPLGYEGAVNYLSTFDENTLNDQFISRKVTYLLGNGSGPDPSLNTSDCDATLLGSTRFKRGENMFSYMENFHSTEHNHQKVIVEGIGHNGQGMYASPEFRSLLNTLLD
jgi:hypothetical protein